jgi:hypothetical protein
VEPPPAPGDVRQDQSFFGREPEVLRVMKNLCEGRHTLIVGPFGIGKSALMNEAKLILTGMKRRVEYPSGAGSLQRERVMTVSSPVPLGDCLREIAGFLYANRDLAVEFAEGRDDWAAVKKRFTALGVQGMQSAVLESIAESKRKYVVFVANLDRLSATSARFFHVLLSVTVVCGSAMATRDQDPLRCVWAAFERIPLERLPEPVALKLITHLMRKYPMNVVDPVMCRREILRSADGNPFHIKNFLYRAATQGKLGNREIREFRTVEEGPYFNMGPLYMICAGILTAVKFFSVGAEKREHYIYYSALGFMLYITFRVFRSFFIFRPQRKR